MAFGAFIIVVSSGVGLDTLPDGLREVLDSSEENSPIFLRAKKKLEDYLPFETQLVSLLKILLRRAVVPQPVAKLANGYKLATNLCKKYIAILSPISIQSDDSQRWSHSIIIIRMATT